MKRPYYRKRSSGIPWWTYGIAVLVVIVLIGIRFFVPDVFVAMATPFWNLGSSLTNNVVSWSAELGNKEKLQQQNAALAAQIQTLTNENQVLAARAQDLTKLLGGQSTASNEVAAGVLAAPPESPYDTLVIAVGASDGIATGNYIYSAGGIPIGTVSKVNESSSIVSLFSTPGRSTSGWIGDSRIPVTLNGLGAGAFSATVSASTTIAVGNVVYIPGPGALPIGTVARVDTDPSSPTPVVHIQPNVNLFSITWVEVARSSP